MQNDIIVVGIDPGSRKVGYGIIEYKQEGGVYRYIDSGTIIPDSDFPEEKRLVFIYDEITKIIKQQVALNRTIFIAQEKFFSRGGLRGGDLIGKACGVLEVAVMKAGADHFVEVNKKSANKTVVGYGGSKKKKVEKHHVQTAVKRKLGVEKDMSFDESDALAVALTVIFAALNDKKKTLATTIKTQSDISKSSREKEK